LPWLSSMYQAMMSEIGSTYVSRGRTIFAYG
jgi:hypothetical protein